MKANAAMKNRSKFRVKMTASLAALAMVGAACGSPEGLGASSASDTFEPTLGSQPVDSDVEFGATLDEFLDVDSQESPEPTVPDGFTEIGWDDLVPPGSSGDEISARFEDRIASVEPGSPEANDLYEELQAEYDNQPVNPDAASDDIYLAGFVAALTYDGDLITEFLLVPYFGACIHVPPPPANQTILVKLAEGEELHVDESWGAVWVTGDLTIDGESTDLAEAGYSISGASTGVYDDY